jgi:hypothetical protein
MPSDSSASAERRPPIEARSVVRLTDSVFGFIAWALHLLVVYVASAVACQLGLGSQPAGRQAIVVGTLCAVTIATAAVVVWHAVRRHRQRSAMEDDGFLARIAVGHDAIAAVAILWQLMPLLMVPLCR